MTEQQGTTVILGGLGFLGSHVSRALVKGGYPTRIFDRPGISRQLIDDIEARVSVVEGDIAHTPDVLAAVKDAHTVIHLVHTTVPGSSMRDPVFDVTSNIAGTVGWLQHLDQTDVQRVLYCSSGGTVYGVAQYNPIDEYHPTNPISSYGISKLAIEKYIAMYADIHGIDYVIMRPSNVFGVGQKLHVGQGVIGVMLSHIIQQRPVEIWGDGKTVRDYLYAEDFTSAVMALLDYTGDEYIFNISTEIGHSVLDIVAAIQKALGATIETVYKPAGKYDVPVSVLDSTRLKRETGWRTTIRFEDGMAQTIEWVKSLKK